MADDDVKLPTGKEMEVLELLVTGREMYGLQLVEASAGKLKRGTVYVLLARMEDKGLLCSREEERDPHASGMPRRLYKIKGLGQRAYNAWHAARSELIPAPAFFGAAS